MDNITKKLKDLNSIIGQRYQMRRNSNEDSEAIRFFYDTLNGIIKECESQKPDASENTLPIADVINCPECGHDKQEPSEHGYDWYCLKCGMHF